MAKKLIDQKDILEDLLEQVAPKYFPAESLDKNRTSLFGYLTEAMSRSIEDTVVLEQRRASDYCPELSNSEIHVRETAQIRGVNIAAATPGKAFAIIGVLKSDILEKGIKTASNVISFTLDRRSTIIHNGTPFSLEDDIIIRAVKKSNGYVYAANYSGKYATYESYLQMFDQVNEQGQEMVTMIVQIYQFNYNIQEKTVTDEIEFLYDGLEFDYENRLAGFDVYVKKSTSDEYKKMELDHYLTMETTNALYYNNDDSGIIYITNNPRLNIGTNATVRIEIRETLGTDGEIKIGNDNTTFSLYRDGSYNYSGVNVVINLLSDTTGASNGDSLGDIKKNLINAKTRRDNITTEHDIITYINDVDANVQIIKKRNDIQDRRYYMYTLLRKNRIIAPATTKRLKLKGIENPFHWGDFDQYQSTVDRKVLRAYNKFKLIQPEDPKEEEYAVKIDRDEPEKEGEFYYTCPFMLLVNKQNILSYYFTSVNTNIILNQKQTNNLFPYQIICREVYIYRDSHNPETFDQYQFTIRGTLNTSNDLEIVDEDSNLIDHDMIKAYIVFRCDNSPVAYLEMNISSYDQDSREFLFTGKIRTTDFITDQNRLEITEGLKKVGTDTNYNSVIDYKNATFDVYFMYKYDDKLEEYPNSDTIFQLLPSSLTNGYELMCGYYNTPSNLYNLILEYDKFTSSPIKLSPLTETTVEYSIAEVPFLEYNYGIKNVIDLYDTFENMAQVYGSLMMLTTDFDVSLKFTATYGRSKYITVTGGRDENGDDIVVNLNNLNPTFYFKVYGKNVDVEEIRNYIYEYLRDTYITNTSIFMSNICTLVEQNFSKVRSIKYMGVDNLDASYQEFTYTVPEFKSIDIITRFVPEQLNVTDIQIDLDEDII